MIWSEIFYYDETSPSCLRWKIDRFSGKNNYIKHVTKDSVVGTCKSKSKYWQVKYNAKIYQIHRIIYEMFYDKIPESMEIDHIDGDSFNNNLSNLRLISRTENNRNRRMQKTNTSGVTGVHFYIKERKYGCDPYWIASCKDTDGKLKTKRFNCRLLGYQTAYEKACEYRDQMLVYLNLKNAGYTERHGKGEF